MTGDVTAAGPAETTLRDGTRVLVRIVQPSDKEKFVEGMARLSTRSRYLRFHTGIERLTAAQLRYLTEVDQDRHVALVAIDLDSDRHPGIGVARFVRLEDEPAVAEAAVTVLDDYQGRGLGTTLLGLLAIAAVRRGVSVFRSYVLGENQEMLVLFDALGARRTRGDGDTWQIDLDLPDRPEDGMSGSAASRVFRAVTGEDLPQMDTTAPPVWVGAAGDRDDAGERPLLRAWLDRVLGDDSGDQR